MKTRLPTVWIAAALALLGLQTARGGFSDLERQALQKTAAEVQKALAASTVPAKEPIVVLPIGGDQDGVVGGLLKNAITAAGRTCVEEVDGAIWDEIMKEIEIDWRKGDILDPATVAKFGRLKAARILLYGAVRTTPGENRVYVELELHASGVETKQHLWGGLFSKIEYIPGQRQGLVELHQSLRKALAETFKAGAASLAGSQKLAGIKKVLVVPLAGDIDGYMTAQTKSMFGSSHIDPVDGAVTTPAEARWKLVEQPGFADAVLYGAVRDLYREPVEVTLNGTNYAVQAEIQLEIQTADENRVKWSDTLSASATYFLPNITTAETGFLIWLRDHWLFVAGAIVLLIAARAVWKATVRAPPR